MRLDRYVGGIFLGFFSLAFFLLTGLFVVADAIGHADEYLSAVGHDELGLTGLGALALAARYYAASVPLYFLQLGPFVTLLAAAATAGRLQRSGELAPMVAAGRSLQRIAAPIFAGGALVALGMAATREASLPPLRDTRDRASEVLRRQRTERVLENLVVPLPAPGRGFTMARAFRPDEDLVEGFRFVAEDGRLVEAPRARWDPGRDGWQLEEGRRTDTARGAASTDADFVSAREAGTGPEELLLVAKAETDPLDLTFGEVRRLAERDPGRLPYQTLLHYFLTFPLANLVLLLLGLPFCLRLERRGRAEGIAIACVLSVAYFGADLVLRDLGGRGLLGPLLGSWSPVVLFGALGIVLFDGMRT